MTPDLSAFVAADAVASGVAWVGAYKYKIFFLMCTDS